MKSTYTIPVVLGLLIIGGLFYLQAKEKSGGKAYTDPTKSFSVSTPNGWYPHSLGESQVVFTTSPEFKLPEGTEGYAIGDQMVVSSGSLDEIVGANTPEEYLAGVGATSTSEFFVSREEVVTGKDLLMSRIIMKGAAADGETLLYVYFPKDQKVITLSHYPYVAGTPSALAFERLVDSFELVEETPAMTATSTKPVTTVKPVPAPTGQRVLGGYIRSVNLEAPVTLSLDDAVWRTGVGAEDAAIRDGKCTEATRATCVKSQFYVDNVSALTVSLLIDPAAKIVMKTWKSGGAGIQDREISIGEFGALINDAKATWNTRAYRVTVKDDIVTMIEEIYTP